jgi:hypothetical protein
MASLFNVGVTSAQLRVAQATKMVLKKALVKCMCHFKAD